MNALLISENGVRDDVSRAAVEFCDMMTMLDGTYDTANPQIPLKCTILKPKVCT